MTPIGQMVIPILILIITFVFGIISLTQPLTIMRITMLWPRFIFPKVSSEKEAPKQFRAMRLIEEDPEQYVKENKVPLRITRFNGLWAIGLSVVGALIVVGDLLTP